FHDGTALDAAAVAFNFERAQGFARFDLGSLIASIATPDSRTVVFTLRAAYAPFLASLATPSFGIVSPTCLRQGPAWGTPATRCAAGTGPFRFESWVAGDRITLARNESYSGRDAAGRALPYLDAITFRAIRDEATRVAELRGAGVQLALDIGPASTAAVRADPNLAIRGRPSYDVSFLGFGTAKPFDVPEVRRAIALAVDRDAIAADLVKIGITVDVRTEAAATLGARSRSGDVPLWLGDRIAERADADEFLSAVSSNAVVQELVRRARAENDTSKRSELYKQVMKLVQQDVARVPLFHAAPPLALVLKVNGLVPQPITRESFATVSLGR